MHTSAQANYICLRNVYDSVLYLFSLRVGLQLPETTLTFWFVEDVFGRFGGSCGDMFGQFVGRLLGHVWQVFLRNFERLLDSFREGF